MNCLTCHPAAKGRLTNLFFGAILTEKFCDVLVPLAFREFQGGFAFVVLGIEVGFGGNENFRDVLVAVARRGLQRRYPLLPDTALARSSSMSFFFRHRPCRGVLPSSFWY